MSFIFLVLLGFKVIFLKDCYEIWVGLLGGYWGILDRFKVGNYR